MALGSLSAEEYRAEIAIKEFKFVALKADTDNVLRQAREALQECVDELDGWIEAHYTPEARKYPSEQRRYERDRASVAKAQEAIAAIEAQLGPVESH